MKIEITKSTDRFCSCNCCNGRTHTNTGVKVDAIYEIRIGIMVNRLCPDCLAALIGKATVALATDK